MMKAIALLSVLAALAFAQRTQPHKPEEGIKKGQKAVAFKLDLLADPSAQADKQEPQTFDLAANIGKKPVVLVFGSYT